MTSVSSAPAQQVPLTPKAALSGFGTQVLSTSVLGYLGLYKWLGVWDGTSNSSNIAFGSLLSGATVCTGPLVDKIVKTGFQYYNQNEELSDQQIKAKEIIKIVPRLSTLNLTILACEALGFESVGTSTGAFGKLVDAIWNAPTALPVAGAAFIAAKTYDYNVPIESAIIKPLAVFSGLFMTAPIVSSLMHHMWNEAFPTCIEALSWQVKTCASGIGGAFFIGINVYGALLNADKEIEQRNLSKAQITFLSNEKVLAELKEIALFLPDSFALMIKEAKNPKIKKRLLKIAQEVALEKKSFGNAGQVLKELRTLFANEFDKYHQIIEKINDPQAKVYWQQIIKVTEPEQGELAAICAEKIFMELQILAHNQPAAFAELIAHIKDAEAKAMLEEYVAQTEEVIRNYR